MVHKSKKVETCNEDEKEVSTLLEDTKEYFNNDIAARTRRSTIRCNNFFKVLQ